MRIVLKNNAVSRLAMPVSAEDASIQITAADAALFPAPVAGEWFPVTVIQSNGELEIMHCTARSETTLTVARAQEGTAAKSFNAGDRVELRATVAALDSLVRFQQSGTGAVPRTLQDKAREVVSVKDFGAVGDGVADDTAAIQAGIDHLASAGGGTLHFMRGEVYGTTGTLYVKTGVRLVGDGKPVIRAIAAFQGSMVQFGYTTGKPDEPLSSTTNPCHDASIEGIEIDGAYLAAELVRDPDGIPYGFMQSGLVEVYRASKRNKIITCDIHSAEQSLVKTHDGTDFTVVRGCKIHDITTFSAATQFINLMNITGSDGCVIEANDVYDMKQSGYAPSSWGHGLRLHATDTARVADNRIVGGWNGILVDGRNNLVINNAVSGAGRAGIYLTEDPWKCRFNTVVANNVDGNGLVGIEEKNSPDVDSNYILNNTIRNAASPLLVPTVSVSLVQGNKAFNVAGVLQPEIVRIPGLHKGSTVDASSNLTAGSWVPSTIENTNNTASTTIESAHYTRIGNIVHVSGKAQTTLAASGSYEFRIAPPIASIFSADSDANGTANDNWSSYGNMSAMTTGARHIRVQGTAASAGVKEIRFSGTYIIK